MRIVICEFMDERAVNRLRSAHDVHYDAALVDDAPALLREAAGADALVVRNRTQVRGALLEALVRCRAVGRLGVGLDNIDVPGCEARGMRVIPASGANALSVAEYVVTAALMLLRGAYASTPAVAGGQWPRTALSSGREAAGRTLGLIGYGSIGQLTARLARGLGLRVIAFDAMMDGDHPAYAWTTALLTVCAEPRNAYEIVGVVSDVRYFGLKEKPEPMIYVPVWRRKAMPAASRSSTATAPASDYRGSSATFQPKNRSEASP